MFKYSAKTLRGMFKNSAKHASKYILNICTFEGVLTIVFTVKNLFLKAYFLSSYVLGIKIDF